MSDYATTGPYLRIPYPDTHDTRQAYRPGSSWPRHKARKRNRRRSRKADHR